MSATYYTCNLLPASVLSAASEPVRWLGDHLGDASSPMRREISDVHPMTCPYVTSLARAAEQVLSSPSPGNRVVVPGGCDAMRRLGDLLAAAYPKQVFTLLLPRSSDERAVHSLALGLAELEVWLSHASTAENAQPDEASADKTPDTAGIPAPAAVASSVATCRATIEPPTVLYPKPPEEGGVFVVAGPLNDNSLLQLIIDLGSRVAGLESCTSPDRRLALDGSDRNNSDALAGSDTSATRAVATGYESMAAAMLAAATCPRSSTPERRAYLAARLDEARPSAIIYARQSFCDPGAYDALEVARLAKERGLPYLEIEVGFPFEVSGPLRTRVEAFLEAQTIDNDLLDIFDDFDDLDDPADSGTTADLDNMAAPPEVSDPARPAPTERG